MSDTAPALPPGELSPTLGESDKSREIVQILTGYKREAENNRTGGPAGRDEKWRKNLNHYWGIHDFSHKQDWQSKVVMPDVASYVDRFAAAMKEALVATPNGFYTVVNPSDPNNDLTQPIKSLTDVWLSAAGFNQTGSIVGFPAVFEEQMKMGALMASAAVVQWRADRPYGRVSVETVDPRQVWMDHTYRNLYRIRRTEIDLADLPRLVDAKTRKGAALFNRPEIARLVAGRAQEDQREKSELTGSGAEVSSSRRPIVLDEYIATVMDGQGRELARDALMIVADDTYLLRGPEANPYWHKQDWLVYTPLVTAPLSVYGRSYMEDFGQLTNVFNELTNLLMDAVYTSSMNAFFVVPDALVRPQQLATGIQPNVTYEVDAGYRPEDVIKELSLGRLDPGGMTMWQALKASLSEAAGINEIGMGQFAPNSRTSATEISATMQSSSALIRSVAQTVESRFLNPILDLIWKTGLQHAKVDDPALMAAAGPEMWQALHAQRRSIIRAPITFQAQGISALIQKSQILQSLIQLMQVLGANETLAAAFLQTIDPNRLLALLFNLANIDMRALQATDRERMMQQVMQPLQQAAGGGQTTPAASAEMSNVAQSMGIGRRG